MIFEIKINKTLCNGKPLAEVYLYTKTNAYNCAFPIPTDNLSFVSAIELGINQCIAAHEKRQGGRDE